ncbi:MAG: hypothetical protein M3O50_11840 [Myxococcota bacterium]|nr:hypothetical protein [Myxococcota bacterium]
MAPSSSQCVRPLGPFFTLIVATAMLAAAPARAAPWFGWGENSLEDSFEDGDIDEEDALSRPALAHADAGVLPGATGGATSLSLAGFFRARRAAGNDAGAFLVLRVALDRVAAGTARRSEEGSPSVPSTGPPVLAPEAEPPLLAAQRLARRCVAAALRAGGFAVEEARLDDLIARSRASAWLPEARLRAMHLLTDSARIATVAATNGTSTYDTAGAHLVLELRMTWRFDRLLFAGDEPALEKLRIEREDARSRLANTTLEALFTWQRAAVDLHGAIVGSREQLEAGLRVAEAAAKLDVLTGGWFSDHAEHHGGQPRPAPAPMPPGAPPVEPP